MSEELIAAIRDLHTEISRRVGRATRNARPTQVADLRELPSDAGQRHCCCAPAIGRG